MNGLVVCVTYIALCLLPMSLSDQRDAKVYYVSAPDGTPCPDSTLCHDISHYANNSDFFFTNNSMFHFLKGNHILNKTGFLKIANVENITFQGEGDTTEGSHHTVKESSVQLTCLNFSSGLLFIDSRNVTIRNITIKNCSSNIDSVTIQMLTRMGEETKSQRWKRREMAVVLIETSGIFLDHVSILESIGYGLVTINGLGITIKHCSFAYNNRERYNDQCERRECVGGNALLVYTYPQVCDYFHVYQTTILQSNFSFGFDPTRYTQFVASGLAIFLEQMDAYGIDHVIENVVFYGNSGVQGANFRYTATRNVKYHTLMLNNVNSSHANQYYKMDQFSHNIYGAGLYIYIGRNTKNAMRYCFNESQSINFPETTVTITNLFSSRNNGLYGSGLYLFCDDTTENRYSIIENSSFIGNTGLAGAGILIVQENQLNYLFRFLHITVSYCQLSKSTNIDSTLHKTSSAILVRRSPNITFVDLNVSHNPFTGLFLLNAQATFRGEHVVFVNNTAMNGGGMQIHGDSSIILQPPVEMKFLNNSALGSGGGIFVNPTPYITQTCFFQPTDQDNSQNMTMDLGFINNSATLGGSVVYGANVDSCYLTRVSRFSDPERRRTRISGREAFETVFDFTVENGPSLISSDPERICFCYNNTPDCSERDMSIQTIPGIIHQFSIVAVGVLNGTSPAITHLEEFEYEGKVKKSIRRKIYSTGIECSNVPYSAVVIKQPDQNSMPVQRSVDFFVNQPNEAVDLIINVTINPCPTGFQLSEETSSCVCNRYIEELNRNVTCNPQTESFIHNGSIWFGYDEQSQCFITSSDCEFNYCFNNEVNFTIQTQDDQCVHGRSGIMCGQCAKGYSLMLGSNKCGKCTNDTLALLVVFAVAGVALVLLLLCLNLTVSFGTINGLIFYANILKLHEDYFFPDYNSVSPLTLFISILNLDFGIPTCFISSLNATLKTWLQFVFPVYLWLTVIVIAVVTHFSSRISKLFGRNIISVIATLLLLSFTKLFRVCVLVWQVGHYYCNGKIQRVWAFDANVDYWSSEHTAMVIVAAFVFVFLALPYTLILVFSPLIEKYLSRLKLFWWWVKLKPFIDAYDGPYRDKYRFWTGLLLLARLILVPVISVYPKFGIGLTIVVLAILLSIIAFTSGLYRHKALDFLEVWFILQTIFVVSLSGGNTSIVGTISASLVLTTFFGIIVYHILYRLNLTQKIENWIIKKWENRSKVSVSRALSAYSHELFAKTQNPRNYTSVKVNQNAMHLEDNVWVVNKRETLLRDFSE